MSSGDAISIGVTIILTDAQLTAIADRVADRVSTRAPEPLEDSWFDTRSGAAYLGVHPDSLRKLASARRLPCEQAGPGCKLYFRRSALDELRSGFHAASTLRP